MDGRCWCEGLLGSDQGAPGSPTSSDDKSEFLQLFRTSLTLLAFLHLSFEASFFDLNFNIVDFSFQVLNAPSIRQVIAMAAVNIPSPAFGCS